MRSAERRFTWALIAGGIATGLGAGQTNSAIYNVLVGVAWGVPVFIGTWAVLEALTYLQEVRDAPPRRPSRSSNVYIMPSRKEEEK